MTFTHIILFLFFLLMNLTDCTVVVSSCFSRDKVNFVCLVNEFFFLNYVVRNEHKSRKSKVKRGITSLKSYTEKQRQPKTAVATKRRRRRSRHLAGGEMQTHHELHESLRARACACDVSIPN